MEIKLITGEGVLLIDTVKSITIPTLDGQRTLLNKHSDTMIALGFGKGYFKTEEGMEHFVMSGGIASLQSNRFTLIPEKFSFSPQSKRFLYDESLFKDDVKFLKLLETINENAQ